MDNAAFLSVVPRDLQEQARWVVWRVELRPTRNGEKKPTKVPYNARTGALASSTDVNTWSIVKTALRALERSDEYNGVGFVTGKELGITGIDLDHCRDSVTEEIEPWALAICDQMQSYTEISPSQTGLRIFIRASLPPGRRRQGSLEMYDEGRFFTVTGNALLDYPLTIEARQVELEQLHKATFAVSEHAPRKRTPSEPVRLDDQALLKKAQEAKNGQKFFHLWRGEASEYGEDLSRADLALCGMLAFWTGGDASRMDRLFRQSGLMRDKWDDQRGASTYGQRTILTALSTIGDTYSPIPLQSRAKHSQKDSQQEDQPQTDGSSALKSERTPPDADDSWARHCTDLGNSRRFVRLYGADVRHVSLWNKFLVWDGKRWRMDETNGVKRLAKLVARDIYREAADTPDDNERRELAKWAAKTEGDARLRAMLSQAESEEEIASHASNWDTQPWLLAVMNGVLDLRTGKLLPHAREHHITRLAPVAYDPKAQCPTWQKFLDRIMGGNDAMTGFLQRAVGYTLTDDIREQVFFLLHGAGRNGKSTFLEALMELLGDYAMGTPTKTLMASRDNNIPNDVARLKGARFVKAVETQEGKTLDESLVKQMTGGDMISARFMRGEWFDFKPTFKIWLAANHLPTIRGTDDGIWRRIRYIPFKVQIPEDEVEEELPSALRAEYPGILAWAVRGCLEWQKSGLGYPEEVKRANQEYRDSMDHLGRFISDTCIQKPGIEVSAKAFRMAYQTWCSDNGEHERSQTWVGRELQRLQIERDRDGSGATVYRGIGLRLTEGE